METIPLKDKYGYMFADLAKLGKAASVIDETNVYQEANKSTRPLLDKMLERNLLPGTKLEGIENPEQAEILKNAFLEIDREDAIPLEEGQYFIVDLIGLEVYTEEGKLLGKVDDIYNAGANDIYVIKDELGKQILLPGIEEVIKQVELENGKIIVHLIPGLI